MKNKTPLIIVAILIVVALIIVLVVTSANKRNFNKYDSLLDDDNMEIKNANVEEIEIAVMESFPVQVAVTAYGQLPDGCTELHDVLRERDGNTFNVTMRTERPYDAVCTQQVRMFEETFPLDVENLLAGDYLVNVNGVTDTFTLQTDNLVEFDAGEK